MEFFYSGNNLFCHLLHFYFGASQHVSFIFIPDPKSFDQGLVGGQPVDPCQPTPRVRPPTPADLHTSGAALASKALAYGSLLAIGGCSVLFFGIWKLSGAKDFQEFRQVCGGILPKIPKKENQGKSL